MFLCPYCLYYVRFRSPAAVHAKMVAVLRTLHRDNCYAEQKIREAGERLGLVLKRWA